MSSELPDNDEHPSENDDKSDIFQKIYDALLLQHESLRMRLADKQPVDSIDKRIRMKINMLNEEQIDILETVHVSRISYRFFAHIFIRETAIRQPTPFGQDVSNHLDIAHIDQQTLLRGIGSLSFEDRLDLANSTYKRGVEHYTAPLQERWDDALVPLLENALKKLRHDILHAACITDEENSYCKDA